MSGVAREFELVADVAPPPERDGLRRQAADLYRALGHVPPSNQRSGTGLPVTPSSPRAAVKITESDLDLALEPRSGFLETIIDRLTEDWSGLAEQLRDVLREHKAEDASIRTASSPRQFRSPTPACSSC